jgi:spoIIIJ-associated protein
VEESILFAKKYLEDLLSFFGLNTDVYATSDEEVIELSVPSTHMNGFLIGQHGDTMRSLQYLVCTALSNGGYTCTRVNVDIADYKKGRQDRLAQQAMQWIDKVKQTGKPFQLAPMNAADRRIIHKVADENGLTTESFGFGRDRHVVINAPATGAAATNPQTAAVTEDVIDDAAADEALPAIADDEARRSKKPERAQSLDEYFAQQEAASEKAESKDAEPDEAKPKTKKTTKKTKE